MKSIIVLQAFKFAHQGYLVEEFEPGKDPIDTTDDCAELAIAEKWAKPAAKAAQRAPENKAEALAPEDKHE